MAPKVATQEVEEITSQVLSAPVELLNGRLIYLEHRLEHRVTYFLASVHSDRDMLCGECSALMTHRITPLAFKLSEIIVECAEATVVPVILITEAFQEADS